MKAKDFKKLVKAFDHVKDFDFVKSCWTYNEYLFWAATFLDIKTLKEVK